MINVDERLAKLEKQVRRLFSQICCNASPTELVWGSITGALSDQTDLNTELSAKENSLTFTTPYFTRVGDTISIVDAAADGVIKGISTFAASDFNATAGVISIDYVNGQAASDSVNGFMTTGAQTFEGTKVFNDDIGIGTASPDARLEIESNSLGGNNLDLALSSSGIILRNTTAAAASAQQVSPALVLEGQGWKSNATAASQPVQARLLVIPFQGAANPTGSLRFQFSVNGGTVTEPMHLTSAGALTTSGNITASSLTSGAANFINFSARSMLTSPVNGNLRLTNAAQSDFGMLQFGGTTSSFPALKRTSTTLQARLADDSGFAPFDVGLLTINGIQEFADNAAAITGGLTTGQVYRTADVLKIVH